MKSHTIPQKLLEQFAFYDKVTDSLRLWRYEKGRAPFKKAPPKGATVIPGHFSDPRDANKELELETRLAREVEEPVNAFLGTLGYRTFVFSPVNVRQLTTYISLLFTRSKARQLATRQLVDIKIESMRKLLANDEQLSKIAAKWTMDLIEEGHHLSRPVTKEEVAEKTRELIEEHLSEDQLQHDYAGAVERMMANPDEKMAAGAWGIIRAEPDNPFVIGDAPVVTWERTDQNLLLYGQGFSRPNVEVVLPVSPTTCLHILPAVERKRQPMIPTTQEVNTAQASFATQHCFTNICSNSLDSVLQSCFGRVRLGINAFSVRHRDYSDTMFNLLMNRGHWTEPPLRQ
jgi:hypothetical protein